MAQFLMTSFAALHSIDSAGQTVTDGDVQVIDKFL